MNNNMTTKAAALAKIIKICGESSDYSRRVSWVHELAMQALGLTENQRKYRHDKSLMRSEEYKEALQSRRVSEGQAKKALKAKIAEDADDFYFVEVPNMKRRACE